MRKIFLSAILLISINIFSVEIESMRNENVELKTFSTLKEAAENYVEVMQIATDINALENIQSINPNVDAYVLQSNDDELKKKWTEINMAIIKDIEYSVYKVNELKSLGEVKILILAYDKDKMREYMDKNSENYYILNEETQEKEVSVEAYVDMLYEYLASTSKIQVGIANIDFVKGKNGWKIIEKNK